MTTTDDIPTDDQRAIRAIACPACRSTAGAECAFGDAAAPHLPSASAPGVAHRERVKAWHDVACGQNENADADRGTGVLEVRKRCLAYIYDTRGRLCDEGEVWLEAGTIITGISDVGDLAVSGEPNTWYKPLDSFRAEQDLITAAAWSEEIRWNAMIDRAKAAMPAPTTSEDYSPIGCLSSSFAVAGWVMFGDRSAK